MLDAILDAAFPKSELYIYEKVLKTIKLRDFNKVAEFEKKFYDNVKFANFCLQRKEQYTDREIFNFFENSYQTNNVIYSLKRI
jgi:hypothetical protein